MKRVEPYTNRAGGLKFRVVTEREVFDCNGKGYNSESSALKGYYRSLALRAKYKDQAKWVKFKSSVEGKQFIDNIRGKKLTLKLIQEICTCWDIKLPSTTTKVYNMIKTETNKECCYGPVE